MNKIALVITIPILIAINFTNTGCRKKDNYSSLTDTCLVKDNAAFRRGQWNWIKQDCVIARENYPITFINDSVILFDQHPDEPDTFTVAFPECNLMTTLKHYYQGQWTSSYFEQEIHYHPQDSILTLVNYDILGGHKTINYYKKQK